MKKALIGIVMLIALVAFGATQAEAADIAVTVTVSEVLSVTITPTSWAIGPVSEGSTTTTWTDTTPAGGGHFTATNTGNSSGNLTISVTNSVNWTAGASPGDEVFAMGHGQTETLGTEPTYTNITNAGVALTSDLAAEGDYKFDLQFEVPTNTAYGGTEQSMTVAISIS